MDSDALIRSLAADLRPVPRNAVGLRIAAGLGVGGAATVALIGWWLGFRPDFDVAMRGYTFWMKWIYTASLGTVAVSAAIQLARPEPVPLRGLWLLGLPVLLLAAIGLVEMARTPSDQWFAMWLGRSWKQCPWIVLRLSIPIFIGLLWAYRRLAPTRLRAAGAAAGLAAGACAATLYCLHCPETSAMFVLTWYSLGIAAMAAIGALVGPRLLRW
ncbi:NrsF family protein [Rhizorhabdus dicambivorans]|uniref:DUF1109 domain-containing protein n=1 Tax=Rhizorhabdus dicambivorans TaxID=1850238 RepID=A0A2A4FVZ6_9SPHN|nr:DUF1109 domain-containing protein [Rhizorhabdus dicambivorans]ATE65557.1 DUF1109 domain-containing protein [Rhizorhabdus dicambivorans]PCE41900.1 DUF1109 domain-containing protein [Rhizorhabdus dicambivorans]